MYYTPGQQPSTTPTASAVSGVPNCPTCGGFAVVPHPTRECESLVCPDCEGYGTALAAKLRARGYDLDALDRDNPYAFGGAE